MNRTATLRVLGAASLFAESGDPSLLKPQIDAALRYGAIGKPIDPVQLIAPESRR